MNIEFTLPYPPTINHAYGQRKGGGKFIKPAGIAFRAAVAEIVASAGYPMITGRVSLFVRVYPATRAKQDLDNRSKALQDALTHAGVWLDDEQIDDLHMVRGPVFKGGMVKIAIAELKPQAGLFA
jgi:crossover junction endodeoxyribonuclease RusA